MSASRIAVEILGQSGELQKASAAAADALKGLGDVLKRQTDSALALGDSTVRSNALIARSYQATAREAGLASERTVAAFDRQGAVALGSARKQVTAFEQTAVAGQRSAQAQVRASEETAAASSRAADTHVRAAKRSEAAFGSTASSLTRAGKVISLGLVGAAAASLDMAVKFQANTLRMQTQAGATAKQLDLIRQGLLKMAPQVGYTPNKLADGMYHVVSSMTAAQRATFGVSGELKVMRTAAQLAQVGHSHLEDTTYALVSALQALHEPLTNVGKVAGQVNATVGAGDMTMTDFVEALKSGLLPAAKVAGISLQSVGSAMAAMGDQGMRGSLAGTRLRMSIALLSSPSKAAATVLDTLGLSSKEATSRSAAMSKALEQAGLRTTQLSADLRKPDGIAFALKDLRDHLMSAGLTATGAAAVMNKAFGGGRMGATITLLENNLGRVDSKFHQIGSSANQFGADWTKTTHTTAFELHAMEAQAAALGTRIGTDLLPVANTAIHDFSQFVTWLERGSVAAHAFEVGVGAIATVALGSYATSAFKKGAVLFRDLNSAMKFGGTLATTGSVGQAKAAGAGASLPALAGVGRIFGAKGPEAPGSIANPIVVAQIAGQYAGLSSMGAAGTVGTEQKVAQVESGAVSAAAKDAGIAAPAVARSTGVGAAEAAAATAGIVSAEKGATTGVLSALKGGLASLVGGLMKGGLIAGGGTAVSQLAGHVIGGKAGKTVSQVGTAASVGAGLGSLLGPEGTLAGGVTGGLVGGFAKFMANDANRYGNDIARRVTAPLGRAVQAAYAPRIAKPLNTARDFQQAASSAQPVGRNASVRQNTAADLAQAVQHFAQAGRKSGEAFVKAEQAVRFPSTLQVFQYISDQLGALPAKARGAAANTMLRLAQTMQSQGRLPKGAMAELIRNLEMQFPGLDTSLKKQGASTAADFAATMKMTTAVSNTKQLVSTLTDEFGRIFQTGKINSGNLLTTVTADFQTLKTNMGEQTRQGRIKSEQEMGHLKQVATSDAEAMNQQVSAKFMSMKGTIISGSSSAAAQASTAFETLASNIATAVSSGTVSTAKGVTLIAQALNNELVVFGQPKLPMAVLRSLSPQALLGEQKFLTQGATSGAQAAPGHRATGGWIGSSGEKGRDAVPAMLGRGEAVLKHQDQAIVNSALAHTPYGSLDGVFAATQGQKHYMSSGGYAGYSLPLPRGEMLPGSWSLDMGVDIPAPAGTPEYAIGPGVITGEGISGFGPNAPILHITAGPLAGRNIYYGHAGPDTVRTGQQVTAGQQISEVGAGIVGISTGPHIEIGLEPPFSNANGPVMASILRALMSGAGITGIGSAGLGGAAGITVPTIKTPNVKGVGAIADIVRGTLGKATKGANAYLQSKAAAAGASGASGSFSGTLSGPVAHQVFQYMTQAGFNKVAIAGMLGNAVQESSMNPNTPGGGLWQQVTNFGSGTGGSLLNQMNRMLPQIQGLKGAMNAAGSPGQAAAIFEQGFEHAGIIAMANRIAGANAAFRQGYGGGGFVPGFATGVHHAGQPAKPKKPKIGKTPKSPGTSLSAKDMQALADVGGQVNSIETVIARLTGRYQADQTLFGPEEAMAQYLNPDGSLNAAGYAKKIADDQKLLGIDTELQGLYKAETPVVSKALRKWLGNQAGTNRKIASNKLRIARNKLKEGSIRKAILDLSKPGKNTVKTIEDQIAQVRHGWEGHILAAEQAKLHYDESAVPREVALEQAVINAQRRKLGSSAVNHADSLKQAVLSAQAAEHGYTGKNHATKRGLSARVNQARQNYSEFLLSQAPIRAQLSAGAKGAALNLREYLLHEKPTRQQLTDSLANTRLSEQAAVYPLEGALIAARSAQAKRAQRVKVERFQLREQLAGLTREDVRLGQTDTALTGILTGANGGDSTNKTVNVLETVAGKLGMIKWGPGGNFAGLDTTMPGEVVNVQADIQSLKNDIAQTQGAQTTATTSATDNSELDSLLQQQNLQLSEALALNEAQTRVLAGMIPEIPRYEKGGPVLDDGLIYAHRGEHVVPKGGTLVQGSGGATTVELHQHLHGDMAGLANFIDQRISHPDNVRAVSSRIGRRTSMLAGAPGGFRR